MSKHKPNPAKLHPPRTVKLADGTFDELSEKADEICSRWGNATQKTRQSILNRRNYA